MLLLFSRCVVTMVLDFEVDRDTNEGGSDLNFLILDGLTIGDRQRESKNLKEENERGEKERVSAGGTECYRNTLEGPEVSHKVK